MGTPEFAMPSLIALLDKGYDVCAVVTQPDKAKGRGNKVNMSPVKAFALKRGIKVLQPKSAKSSEFALELKDLSVDLFVTVAYGKILSKMVLEIPILGCINVHGSLLPRYRGAGPIQWSLIKGEGKTGITTMFTDVGMDTGDMLLSESLEIDPDMNSGELHDVLKEMGARVLIDTLRVLEEGGLKPIPQKNEEASYAPMMQKETGKIIWKQSCKDIHNLVRGVNPWPGAYTSYCNEKMRIWKTNILDMATDKEVPGKILKVSKDGIVVATLDFAINISEIQFDGGKRMKVSQYLCGHRIHDGEELGEED